MINNKSDANIYYSYYLIDGKTTKEDILSFIQTDVKSIQRHKPLKSLIRKQKICKVKTAFSRDDLIDSNCALKVFVWIIKESRMAELGEKKYITEDDLDYKFIGTSLDFERIQWLITY